MPESQEELEALRKKNASLRDQLASAQSKEAENVAARQSEFRKTQLEAENARLEAEVAAAKQRSKVETSKAGSANVLQSAQAQLEAATALKDQPAGVVDVNSEENRKKKDTGLVKATSGDAEPKVDTGTASVAGDVRNGGNI